MEKVLVFHAGTKYQEGKTVTNGGRVLGVTGLAPSIKEAIEKTYNAVSKIKWEGAHYRTDIGKKAFKHL